MVPAALDLAQFVGRKGNVLAKYPLPRESYQSDVLRFPLESRPWKVSFALQKHI